MEQGEAGGGGHGLIKWFTGDQGETQHGDPSEADGAELLDIREILQKYFCFKILFL